MKGYGNAFNAWKHREHPDAWPPLWVVDGDGGFASVVAYTMEEAIAIYEGNSSEAERLHAETEKKMYGDCDLKTPVQEAFRY